MKRKRKKSPTPAQILLATHLQELGVTDILFEYQFLADRKFRFDLYSPEIRVGFECNGHFAGKHGRGWDGGHDNEKIRLAQLHGFRILPFTNREVMSGSAKEFLRTYLWGGVA